MAARTQFSEALKDLPPENVNVVSISRRQSETEIVQERYRSVLGWIPDQVARLPNSTVSLYNERQPNHNYIYLFGKLLNTIYCMEISFQTSKLQKLCENLEFASRRLGPDNATKLRRRLADIIAADNVTDIIAGNPHSLKGDREGQFSVSLAGGTRLVFKPDHDTVPKRKDGSVNWASVTSITVCFIGDYHD